MRDLAVLFVHLIATIVKLLRPGGTYVDAARKFVDAGFNRIVLLAVGPDQEAFIRFFEAKLADELRSLRPARR